MKPDRRERLLVAGIVLSGLIFVAATIAQIFGL